MTFGEIIFGGCVLLTLSVPSSAQSPTPAPARPDIPPLGGDDESERWNLYYQATSIGDYHPPFNAPYSGPLSLLDVAEHDVSITTTLFFTARLEENTYLVFNPEIAGARSLTEFTAHYHLERNHQGRDKQLLTPLAVSRGRKNRCHQRLGGF